MLFRSTIALGLGWIFIKKAWLLLQAPTDRDVARSLFKYSILYMMALSAGMVLDSLPVTQTVMTRMAGSVDALLQTGLAWIA